MARIFRGFSCKTNTEADRWGSWDGGFRREKGRGVLRKTASGLLLVADERAAAGGERRRLPATMATLPLVET